MGKIKNSSTPTADLILHPVRWRILLHVMGREVTTTELKNELTDVPSTTLYRHVAALVEAGFLTVVRERRVRGATERTLTVDQTAAAVDDDEAGAMSVEHHRQAFLVMLAQVAAGFDRLVESGAFPDRVALLNYRQLALYVDEGDAEAIGSGLLDVLGPYLEPAPGKRRIVLSTITVPDD